MQPDPESEDKDFDRPVLVNAQAGRVAVASVRQAYDLLADVDWPAERGDRHRDAVETCLKVLDGHRAASDAREAFIAAARAGSVLADR